MSALDFHQLLRGVESDVFVGHAPIVSFLFVIHPVVKVEAVPFHLPDVVTLLPAHPYANKIIFHDKR